MNVTPPNGWGKIVGMVTGLDSPGHTTPLRGVVFATGEKGFSVTLKADANGNYAFWAPVNSGPFSLIASASGWIAQIKCVGISAGMTTTVSFTLRRQSLLAVVLSAEPPGGAGQLRRAILGARWFGVLIVLLELMVACGSQQPPGGSQTSLIAGTVIAGPVTPVEHVGRPNTRPLPGATVEALRGGDVVAAARSDDRGRYQLTIRPGTYLIRVRPPGRFLSKNPVKTVTISAGETLTVDFLLDTGIR